MKNFEYSIETLRDFMDLCDDMVEHTADYPDDINATLVLLSGLCAKRILEQDDEDEDARILVEAVENRIIGIVDYLMEGLNKFEGIDFNQMGEEDTEQERVLH